MKKQGKVWLVGAGPSDAGLFTLKGKQVLEQAEVVVYDKLVGQGILSMMPADAKKIDVGKRSGNHPVPQERINEILLEEAQNGNRVVRLKGGDPFVFGRGGEELELLAEQGIPFEIVPGITSAVSVPAYAGIPVTHRDCCSSLHLITAHAKRGSDIQIDYPSLVKLDGTLVFLMGLSAVQQVCAGLLEAGIDPDMPAAVLERGTTAYQRRVVSTVSELPEQVLKADIQPPAIIIVGRVCALADKFHWAEDRPLGGRRVFVTRPKDRASRLTDKLRELGAEVVELPAIRTQTLERNTRLGQAFSEISTYSWAVFTSVAGVEAFFAKLREKRIDIRKLCSLKFAAIGSATRDAIEQRGILVEYMPLTFDAEMLAKGLASRVHPQERVLITRALQGTEVLPAILSQHGIAFDDIPVYETKLEKQEPPTLLPKDFVAFTSASTVRGFAEIMGSDYDFRQVNALCIGKQTAEQAEKHEMKITISKEATMESMVDALLENSIDE